ncbi:MAG: glycosyltransferase [Alphaproteobacteria bacterium]|nr:glycosyltransferase [Alphaproteobacteria bacterium]
MIAPRLSLVIPCYNEAANLPALLERCRAALAGGDMEIILVDNGSSDASPQLLAEATAGQTRLRAVRVPVNQGYGFGILAGLRAAHGTVLGWTHADLQTDPADAVRGLALFDGGGKIFVKGLRYGRPAGDIVFTLGMAAFETLLLGYRFRDINAQPTMFPRALFNGWGEAPHDFSLDLFAYWSARRSGYDVRRFPVHFGARLHGASHWNVDWRSKAGMIGRTAAFSWRLRRNIRSNIAARHNRRAG